MPKVRFMPDGLEAQVAPGTSILDAALKCGARVGNACGGNCACSTCHVWVKEGGDTLSEMDEGESDVLDKAFDVRPSSRLGCQAKVGSDDVRVEVTRESQKAWLDEHPQARKAGT